MPALSDAELEAILSQQIELAKTHDKSERSTARDKAIDYYFGEMDKYVPPEKNRSKIVSRDVADTISRILPGIMRVFTASDRMAIAEPVGSEDMEFARQATDGLNFVFWKDNNGYAVVYSATWDALLQGNGIVKTFYDETPVYATSFHSGLTEDQVALLVQDEDTEVLAQTEHVEMAPDPMTGQPVPVRYFDLKVKHKKADGSFVVTAVPPEEFLVDGDAVETEDAAFTDHWQRKTRSDLVKMGHDKEDVWAIPEASRVATAEAAARDPSANTYESTDMSMQLVDYHECFIRVDVDGDGEAELVRACYGGPGGSGNGKLLDWEVWEDENPFDDIKCEPIPHRWLARSVADESIDVQDVKTVLSRQLLNNVYWLLNPQRVVSGGKVKNPDQLDNPTFGGTIFADANTKVENLSLDNKTGETALAGIAYMDEVLQRRTGVSRQTMALDPDALQNQTAEAVRDGKDAAYSQVEMIARNMAEWGWSKVFRKLMRLMIKHQEYAREVMFNGKPVTIDPRYWNADMNVTINVGLGTGSRDRDMVMLQQVLNSQFLLADRFMQSEAFDDAIELLPKIILTMTKIAESAGIRNPEDYYPEYTQEKVDQLKQFAAAKQGQPDPKVQLEQQKMQADAALEQQKSEAQIKREAAQMEADLNTKAQEQQFEREKWQAEFALKQAELTQQRELELLKLGMADVSTVDGGGEKKPADATAALLMEGLGSLAAMVKQMHEDSMRPTRLVRDPVTNEKIAVKDRPQAVN